MNLMQAETSIHGNIVDLFNQNIREGNIVLSDGKIQDIKYNLDTTDVNPNLPFICPGFIDAHVHVESSMIIPSEFARLAVVHGTVATISDPHEIANVLGKQGVLYMIENGMQVPFKFNFGAPSCVPATIFETAGASIDVAEVEELLQRPDVRYLSEMMNFPGVLFNDADVMKKIAAAHAAGKPIDGHAPGLRGEQALQYIAAGISTDHECFTADEALDKLKGGMQILIREGSAAKNFEALIDLLHDWPEQIMFCSDDKHPDSLVDGHLNQLCARAISKGIDVFKVLKAACLNPVLHYKLDVGILRIGDPADFILLQDLTHFKVLKTYIDGNLVASNGKTHIESVVSIPINNFNCSFTIPQDFKMPLSGTFKADSVPVIEALDGQLITNRLNLKPCIKEGQIESDPEQDILKLVVVNRYTNAPIAKALIRNMGLKSGAIASSVAHDSHNIVAVGADDQSLCQAVNLVIKEKGGVSCVNGTHEMVMGLPVAGLMSNIDGYEVARCYTAIDAMAKSLGSSLSAPFMTLSFMALLVIPKLKLSDMGLFDGEKFEFVV
jgi:adenine deaminase